MLDVDGALRAERVVGQSHAIEGRPSRSFRPTAGLDQRAGGRCRPRARLDRPFCRTDTALRWLDIVIAVVGLPVVVPLCLLIAAAIYVSDGGPAIFGQRRIGRSGQHFRCWKFRTMRTDAEQVLKALLAQDPNSMREWESAQKLSRDPRITPLGRFLRKTSLDELPQLFNVLRGEMSIVGPRPIVDAEVKRYGRHFDDYCSVRPGITGLWQISGRNDTSYRRRVALDRMYVRSRSLLTNVQIILRTIPAVLSQRGSY